MQLRKFLIASAFAIATAACSAGPDAPNAVSLFDAPLEQNFYEDGAAYFAINEGELISLPNEGRRFKLRTREAFADFDLSLDFMVEAETNSGLYMRCDTPDNVNPNTCYEINIFEANKDASNRTGAIMRLTPQQTEVPTAGKWSTLNVSAQGNHIVIKVNGITTVDIKDDAHAGGIMAIQHSEGGKLLKMRNFNITPL